ncbi:hypothetical protein AB0G83_18035 [Streptomyces klenkii]|uniref:hypothetical protein n=1 Tax=Streptomyces klenkii TaxID=1420899 RepID=UPI0033F44962
MAAPLLATASPLAVNVLDAQSLIGVFGVLGVGLVLFTETGPLGRYGFAAAIAPARFVPWSARCSIPWPAPWVYRRLSLLPLLPLLAEVLRSHRAVAGRRSGACA